MYILLKRNHDSSKKGYIWELSKMAYDILIQETLKKSNLTLSEEEINEICLQFAPVQINPLLIRGYKFPETKFVIINQPENETSKAIGKFRVLKSIKAVKTKNDFYMLFGTTDDENLVQRPSVRLDLMRHMMYRTLVESDELKRLPPVPIIIEMGHIYAFTNENFMSKPQIGVVFTEPAKLGSFIYFYNMNTHIDEETRYGYFEIELGEGPGTWTDIAKKQDEIDKFEIFIKLKNTFGVNLRSLCVCGIDSDVDFPFIKSITISIDYFYDNNQDGYEVLKQLLDEVYRYNCDGLRENTQLTVKDYGYTKLTTEQALNPDGDLRKVVDFIKAVKQMSVRPIDHDMLYTRLTGLVKVKKDE